MKKLIKSLSKNQLGPWLILVVFILFSFPFWKQGKVPFPSRHLVNSFPPWQYYYGFPVKNPAMPDIGSQIVPWRHLTIKSLKEFQFPLWNPYNFSGTPLLANYQSAPFHPGNFLFFILPLTAAWSTLVLLPLLLASFFTFIYLREIKLSVLAALISSFAFGFCGFMVCWLAYETLPWAILWLPLALYLIEKAKTVQWAGPLLSLVVAFSLFAGHFQTSLYLLAAVFLYLIFQRQHGQWRKLLIFFILGIFLAAPQWLPTIEFYQQSVRQGNFNIGESIPLKYLITFLAPDFFGNQVTRNNWFGHYAEWAGFIGIVPLILGFYGLFFGRQERRRYFFIFLVFLSLVIAIRSPVQKFLAVLKIPVLSTSAFSRIIVLYSFAMAVLAGFGLDRLKKDWHEKKLKKLIFFLVPFGIIFVIVWTWALFSGHQWAGVSKRNLILPSLLFGATGIGFLGGLIRKKWWQQLILFGFLLLTIFDVSRFAKKWLPFEEKEYFYPQLEVIGFLQEKTNKGERVFGNFGSELNFFEIPGVEGYDPLFIKRYGELISSAGSGKTSSLSPLTVLLNKNGTHTYKLINLLGVKYILHARADGENVWAFPFWEHAQDFEKTWEDDQYQVWLNKKSLPRAFLVNNYQVIEKSQTIVDFMLAEETNLEKIAVLEKEPDLEIRPCSQQNPVKMVDYQPNRIVIQGRADCHSLLVLTDNFYPGWQAIVNGETTKIYRTDYTFRAVVVPEGEYEAVFEYQPVNFQWGLILAGLALGAIIVLILVK